jgi:hypothetical protein
MNIMDDVANHLEALELRFRRLDEDHILLAFGVRNLSYELLIIDREPVLRFVAPSIAVIPQRRLPEVIRAANHLNALLVRWGAFWVDPEDNRLGFELAMPATDEVSRRSISCAVGAVSAVDFFFPVFAKVIWAGMGVEEALAAVSAESASTSAHADLEDDNEELDEAI